MSEVEIAAENAALEAEVARLELEGEGFGYSDTAASDDGDEARGSERARLVADLVLVDSRLAEKREEVAQVQRDLQRLQMGYDALTRESVAADEKWRGEAADLARQLRRAKKKAVKRSSESGLQTPVLALSAGNRPRSSSGQKEKHRPHSKSQSSPSISRSKVQAVVPSSDEGARHARGLAKGERVGDVIEFTSSLTRASAGDIFRKGTALTATDIIHCILSRDVPGLTRILEDKKIRAEVFYEIIDDQTILQHAVTTLNEQIVDMVVSMYRRRNISINAADRYGWTALHVACSKVTGSASDERIIRGLLSFPEVDVTIQNNDGNTALHYFCQRYVTPYNVRSVLLQMLARVAPNARYDRNSDALELPTVSEQRLVANFINMRNRNGESALHKAIFNVSCRLMVVQILIDFGADVNVSSRRAGETPLHYAVRLERVDLIRVLLKAGAEIDARGTEKNITARQLAEDALCCASHERSPSAVRCARLLANSEELRGWTQSLELPEGLDVLLFAWMLKEDLSLKMLQRDSSGSLSAELLARFDDHVREQRRSTTRSGKPLTMGIKARISGSCQSLRELSDTPTLPPNSSRSQFLSEASTPGATAAMSLATSTTGDSTPTFSASGSISSFDRQLMAAERSISSDSDEEDRQAEWTAKVADTKKLLTEQFSDVSSWLISHSDLEFIKELGEGAAGKVFRGLFKNNRAAIKVLSSNAVSGGGPAALDEFRKEFEVLQTVRSKYVVGVLGACFEPQVCIVMDLCARGSLHHVLSSRKYQIGWEKAFKFAYEIVKGLQCLHNWSIPIIHRDLKPLNVLLTEYWEAKLCDFGTSRFKTSTNLKTLTKLAGTYTFLAPEAFLSSGYTEKSDIYAFGVLLWELVERVLAGQHNLPFSEFSDIVLDVQIATRAADQHLRPSIHKKCPKGIAAIIRRCWAPEPAIRPTSLELEPLLVEQQRIFKAHKDSWFVGHVRPQE